MHPAFIPWSLLLFLVACGDGDAAAGGSDPTTGEPHPQPPTGQPVEVEEPVWPEPGSPGFAAYEETLPGSEVTFEMVPIPGGSFLMGSRPDEPGHGADERPQVEVVVDPFWMGRCEVTWDEYDVWNYDESLPQSKEPDGMSRPTPAYTDMTFGMGRDDYPAICMTQEAARHYCIWLTEVTGRFYRLPTEAEWEYACRAGTTTAWSFGDDPADLGDFAWFDGNSDGQYQPVGGKKPNPWGLHDMHGNVCEWTLDAYVADWYSPEHGDPPRRNPLAVPEKLYPRVVRGGSWLDGAEMLRSAARRGSDRSWKLQDPQIPKSRWYHTDAPFLGFRVVRPLREPTAEERARYEMR